MKKLIFLIFTSIFLAACSGGLGGSQNPNPDLFSGIGQGTSNIGGCIDSTTSVPPIINLGLIYQIGCSFGSGIIYDTSFFEEVALQKRFWNGIPAAVYIFADGSTPNALAFPNRNILYGSSFFNNVILRQYGQSNYEIPMSTVLAHEWGHQLEFSTRHERRTPDFELEADALSGFYLHYQKDLSLVEIFQALGFTGSLGAPPEAPHGTHGTSKQREDAFRIGVAYVNAINARTVPQPRTWIELMNDISWFVDCFALNKIQSEVTDSGIPRSCSSSL